MILGFFSSLFFWLIDVDNCYSDRIIFSNENDSVKTSEHVASHRPSLKESNVSLKSRLFFWAEPNDFNPSFIPAFDPKDELWLQSQ